MLVTAFLFGQSSWIQNANVRQQALCRWGYVTKFFLENFYILGYNLKNARNKKGASKIPKWPSLRPLALKSKFIRQLEFSENLEDWYGKCCWTLLSNNFFHTNLLILLKIKTVIKSHSLMMGASNFRHAFSISGIC